MVIKYSGTDQKLEIVQPCDLHKWGGVRFYVHPMSIHPDVQKLNVKLHKYSTMNSQFNYKFFVKFFFKVLWFSFLK